ncbi:hypothetical protein GIB67_042093 [Kingdonia uniflora]|uniref:Uncharacterized protein n=1 Tax=Kingdonia uniflora TaxID=39325 RepID=A0A7J7MW46_9MAGN|nr:hypothetical protein GIB67_042093 [Kingdonia uniflora]
MARGSRGRGHTRTHGGIREGLRSGAVAVTHSGSGSRFAEYITVGCCLDIFCRYRYYQTWYIKRWSSCRVVAVDYSGAQSLDYLLLETLKLTEVPASDKLKSFRASQEVLHLLLLLLIHVGFARLLQPDQHSL